MKTPKRILWWPLLLIALLLTAGGVYVPNSYEADQISITTDALTAWIRA